MYRVGEGVKQDYVEAVYWYRLAADQGFATAQDTLGVMYTKGLGVRLKGGFAKRVIVGCKPAVTIIESKTKLVINLF